MKKLLIVLSVILLGYTYSSSFLSIAGGHEFNVESTYSQFYGKAISFISICLSCVLILKLLPKGINYLLWILLFFGLVHVSSYMAIVLTTDLIEFTALTNIIASLLFVATILLFNKFKKV